MSCLDISAMVEILNLTGQEMGAELDYVSCNERHVVDGEIVLVEGRFDRATARMAVVYIDARGIARDFADNHGTAIGLTLLSRLYESAIKRSVMTIPPIDC